MDLLSLHGINNADLLRIARQPGNALDAAQEIQSEGRARYIGFSTHAPTQTILDAIKTGQEPNADVVTGHLSATLCHLGNICARLGRTLTFDPQAERFVDDEEANELVGREYREGHWAALG